MKTKLKMPKFISRNKPSSPMMKQIMIVLIVVLVVFTAFYALKVVGMNPMRESFVQDETPKFTVVLVYSDSCGHCVKFKPTFEQVSAQASEFGANVSFKKVPADEAGPYAQHVNSGIPAVLIEKDGVVDGTKTLVGNMDAQTFKDRLKPLLQ